MIAIDVTPSDDIPGLALEDDRRTSSRMFRWHDIHPAPDNLRGTLTDLSDLADSIAANGLLEPLRVRWFLSGLTGIEHAQIIAGHRRHAAIGMLIEDGRWPRGKRVECVVRGDSYEETSDEQRTVEMLVENLQRVDLDPIEEARGYDRLHTAGWKPARIAAAVGRPVDRVNARRNLLKLPARWQESVSEGTMTLALAAKAAAAPAGSLDMLALAQASPGEWQLDRVIREYRESTAKAATTANANARGLTMFTGRPWELFNDHTLIVSTTPAGLAKVLLPDDHTGLVVSVDLTTAKPVVKIWQPKPATTGDEDDELDPYEAWEAEVARIRAEHRTAAKAWEAQRDTVMIAYARQVATKDAAGALMRYMVGWHQLQLQQFAERLGWARPTGVNKATVEASLTAWYQDARNLTAYIALFLLDHPSNWVPGTFTEPFEQAVCNEIGTPPEMPVLPDPPEDPDENAHLVDDIPDPADEDDENDDSEDETDG